LLLNGQCCITRRTYKHILVMGERIQYRLATGGGRAQSIASSANYHIILVQYNAQESYVFPNACDFRMFGRRVDDNWLR